MAEPATAPPTRLVANPPMRAPPAAPEAAPSPVGESQEVKPKAEINSRPAIGEKKRGLSIRQFPSEVPGRQTAVTRRARLRGGRAVPQSQRVRRVVTSNVHNLRPLLSR